MSDVDVDEERFNSLPDLLKLFLDQNPDYKQEVLYNGDWVYYNENDPIRMKSDNTSYVLEWVLAPFTSSKWEDVCESYRKFLKKRDSI